MVISQAMGERSVSPAKEYNVILHSLDQLLPSKGCRFPVALRYALINIQFTTL